MAMAEGKFLSFRFYFNEIKIFHQFGIRACTFKSGFQFFEYARNVVVNISGMPNIRQQYYI